MVPFFLDKRRHVDGGPMARRNGGTGDEPPSDGHEPRALGHPFQSDAPFVLRHLEL